MATPIPSDLTSNVIAQHVDNIIDEFATTIWRGHSGFVAMMKDLTSDLRTQPDVDSTYELLQGMAKEMAALRDQQLESGFPAIKFDGPNDVRRSIFVVGVSSTLNLVSAYVAARIGDDQLRQFVFDAFRNVWETNTMLATFHQAKEMQAIVSRRNPIAQHYEAFGRAFTSVVGLCERDGLTDILTDLHAYQAFTGLAVHLSENTRFDGPQALLDFRLLVQYCENAERIADARAAHTPVLSAYRYLACLSGLELFATIPQTKKRSEELITRFTDKAVALLMEVRHDPYAKDYLASPSDVIFTYRLGAEAAQKTGHPHEAQELFIVVEHEADLATLNYRADVGGLTQGARDARTGAEFNAIAKDAAISNAADQLPDDVRELMGDWTAVDPNDERIPKIEVVMKRFGLSGKYSLGMLDQGTGEGLELVVQVNANDLEVEGDPDAKFNKIEEINRAFSREVGPMVGLGTNFEPPHKGFDDR